MRGKLFGKGTTQELATLNLHKKKEKLKKYICYTSFLIALELQNLEIQLFHPDLIL
jgi:hypothetical protein